MTCPHLIRLHDPTVMISVEAAILRAVGSLFMIVRYMMQTNGSKSLYQAVDLFHVSIYRRMWTNAAKHIFLRWEVLQNYLYYTSKPLWAVQ